MITATIKAYVDDLRVIAATMNKAWIASRQAAARIQYLGVQDAPRKRRLDNGPWAGTVFNTSNNIISKTVTLTKWNKGKDMIEQIAKEIEAEPELLFEYKRLERVRGFLCHLAMAYEVFFPYLKGFHLTLSSHLNNRNDEGWKLKEPEWIGYIEEKFDTGKITESERDRLLDDTQEGAPQPPKLIKLVPEFYTCLQALRAFFSSDAPPCVHMRSSSVYMIAYGFADASGGGFGSTIEKEGEVSYRMGVWGKDEDSKTSNWKEFKNLVDALETEAKDGSLKGCLVILAVDSATVESCLYKGNSKSKRLFELVLRFRIMELHSCARFIVSRVSGESVKAQGTDGVSRGNLQEEVSLGQQMISFCPWHLSALERNDKLKAWFHSWLGQDLECLEPEDWFVRGHDIRGGNKGNDGFWRPNIVKGTYLWAPPPAAAAVCLEELRKARIKRQDSLHVVAIPRLMTPVWLKQLFKTADVIVQIKPKHEFWSPNQFEPLTLAICFPYLSHYPWQIRGTPKMHRMVREVRGVQETEEMAPGIVLYQLISQTRRLSTLSQRMVWKLLYFSETPPIPCGDKSISEARKR